MISMPHPLPNEGKYKQVELFVKVDNIINDYQMFPPN